MVLLRLLYNDTLVIRPDISRLKAIGICLPYMLAPILARAVLAERVLC